MASAGVGAVVGFKLGGSGGVVPGKCMRPVQHFGKVDWPVKARYFYLMKGRPAPYLNVGPCPGRTFEHRRRAWRLAWAGGNVSGAAPFNVFSGGQSPARFQ